MRRVFAASAALGVASFAVACVPNAASAAGPRATDPVSVGDRTGGGAAHRQIDRVLILALPGVTWKDLTGPSMPEIARFVDRGGIANLSTRAPKLRNDLAGNYVSLSAGDKAVGGATIPDPAGLVPAGAGFGVAERIGTVSAAQLFTRRAGRPAGAGLVMVSIDQIADLNAATPFAAEVGVFGDALARAGWRRAVIANGDGSDVPATAESPRRAAVAALMDTAGRVPAGRVDAGLLASDPRTPFGRRLDPVAVEAAFAAVWKAQSVVLVEGSDLVRAEAYRGVVASERLRVLRGHALRSTDALAGRLLARVDPERDAVVIVGTAPAAGHGRLAAVAIRAPGVEPGLLRSGTTQRRGFVQMIDVPPSVLELVGVAVPASMRGRTATVPVASRDSDADRRFLVDADRATAFRELVQPPVMMITLVSAFGLVALALLAAARPHRWGRPVLEWWALITLAFFPVTYLTRIVPFHDLPVAGYWLTLGVASGALAVGARTAARGDQLRATALLLAATVGVLAVDGMRGSPLQFNAAFGFSPEVAGRFIGYGNAGYALLAGAALLLAALIARRGDRRARIGAVALLAGVLVIDGAPFWGADVGGVLSLVPAFGLAAYRFLGWQIRPRSVFLALGATAVAVTAATLVDLTRPPGARSHLGRLVEQVGREGPGELAAVIGRKLGMNLASWGSSPLRWVIPLTLVAVIGLVRLAPGSLSRAGRGLDPTGALAIGFPTLAVAGYALNDTGVLVPALMLILAGAVVLPAAAPDGHAPHGATVRAEPGGIACRT